MTTPKVQIASRISPAAPDALKTRAAKAGLSQAQYLEDAIMHHDDVEHVIRAMRTSLGFTFGQERQGPQTLRTVVLTMLERLAVLRGGGE